MRLRFLVRIVALALLAAGCSGSAVAVAEAEVADAASAEVEAQPAVEAETEASVDVESDDAADPVSATPAEPVWEEVAGGEACMCSDGSDWSFWVREADPTRVVFYLQGGGACWNDLTCAPATGFYKTITDASDNPTGGGGIFNFDEADNPFTDWSWVAVPYCTGDMHLGDNSATYGDLTIEHNGLVNGRRAIEEMIARFPDATEVFVTGSSAGGVATPLYAGLIAEQYTDAHIVSLADASGAYANVASPDIAESWGVAGALPGWATFGDEADLTIPGLFVAAGGEYPAIDFARYDNAADEVQQSFILVSGTSLDTVEDLADQIRQTEAFIEDAIGEVPSYVAPGTDHTILGRRDFYELEVDGVKVSDWVAGLVSSSSTDVAPVG